MKCKNQPALVCPIGTIGASARPMAAFSGFFESPGPPPSGNALYTVPAHCDGHRNEKQSGYILHGCFVTCCPGSRQGNTEQVVARWQCQVASGVALDMLHWAMYCFNLSTWPLKWPATEVHSFVAAAFFVWHNRS